MWQGIPFKFSNPNIHDSLTVLIDKLPTISLESATDYTGPVLSGLATLIGGLIPAVIALRAIKANKDQMLAQQVIINRQNFIENLRVKMSIFATDCGRIAIFVERHLIRKGITLRDAPDEIHDKFLDLAYALDREYNYMELLLGDEPRFSKTLSLMKEISEGFLNSPKNDEFFDVHDYVNLLVKETIKCLSCEWKETISIK